MGTSKGNIGRKMYSDPEYRRKISEANRLKRKVIKKNCIRCNKEFEIERKIDKIDKEKIYSSERKCCSKKCASANHTDQHSITTKIKISEAVKKLWLNEEYAKKVISNNRRYSSKGEKEIRNHFIEKYPNDEWSFGGAIRYEDIIISRDLYSKKLKVCVEYDGIWHFKNIKGQLKDKKNKDRLLKKWCKINDYRLIRISDKVYENDKKKAIKMIDRAIYYKKEKYIENY